MAFGSFLLLLECQTDGDHILLVTDFNPSSIAAAQIECLLDVFQHLVCQIAAAKPDQRIVDLGTITPAEKKEAIS